MNMADSWSLGQTYIRKCDHAHQAANTGYVGMRQGQYGEQTMDLSGEGGISMQQASRATPHPLTLYTSVLSTS